MPAEENGAIGGEYWRQAVFYALLVENYRPQWQLQKVRFDFLENYLSDDSEKSVEISVTEKDKEIVTKQIQVVSDKIRNHDFYLGCGKPQCSYCQLNFFGRSD